MTIIELVLSLTAILGAAILFTNSVEMLGERLNLGQEAVGSVLAAVGTALPETMIPLVAILGAMIFGGSTGASGAIGIGAILGAPFLLTTLAMLVVGASALGFRRRRGNGADVVIDREVALRDVAFFLVFYFVAAGAGLVVLPIYIKIAVVIVLLGAYGLYVRKTLKSDGGSEDDAPKNLVLWPSGSQAPTWAVIAQTLGALVVMALGAHFFVSAIEHGSKSIGVPAGLVALIIAPLATELPEKFNSMLWMKDNKDTLAFGNITGALAFQSTIPVSIGILLTEWHLNFLNVFSVALALISGAFLYSLIRSKKSIRGLYLLSGGLLYAIFVAVAVFSLL